MRAVITYLAGFALSTLAYIGTYNYALEKIGDSEFILQETIGIDDYSDRLVWCEVDGVCTIEKRGRIQGIDPVDLIGVATKPYTIYRLDTFILKYTDMLIDRELLKHLGVLLAFGASIIGWCIVLSCSLNSACEAKR